MLFIVTIVQLQCDRSASGPPLHLTVTGTSVQVRMCELCIDKGWTRVPLLPAEQNGPVTLKRLAPVSLLMLGAAALETVRYWTVCRMRWAGIRRLPWALGEHRKATMGSYVYPN